MDESVFARLWNAVKPPPAVDSKPRLRPAQKRVVWLSFGVLVLAGGGVGIYQYLASAPQRAEQEFQAGMRLMEPGNYQKAITLFNRALENSPGLAAVYYERGVAFLLSNQIDKAQADFEQAIALNPRFAPPYSGLGSIYRERHDFQRAMDEYTKALSLQPNLDALFERGQTYEDMGEHQKAIEDYNRAIEELRDAPAVYRARALARRNLGDEAGYVEDRDKARSIEHR